MPGLLEFAANVEWPDTDAAERQRAAAPADKSWGQLAEHAEWLASLQGHSPPQPIARARLVRFGADRDDDNGTDGTLAGVRDVAHVVESEVDAAAMAGARVADDEIDRGADLLVVASGRLTVSGCALVSVMTNTEPVKVIPRGPALSTDEWSSQVVAVRDMRRRAMAHRVLITELLGVLMTEHGTPDLVAVAGFLLHCATRRTPVVIDGPGAAAAAVAAYEVQSRAARWWRVADVSAHPADALALARLAQQPISALSSGLGDGTAGTLAVAVLRAAVHTALQPDPGPLAG